MATTTDQYHEEERIAAAKAERERFDALIGDLMKAVSQRAERNGRDARFVGGDCADLHIEAMLHALLDRLFYTGLLDEREYFREASRHLARLTTNVVQHSDANGAQPQPV